MTTLNHSMHKRRMNEVEDYDSLTIQKFNNNVNTETDNLLCKALIDNLNYNDTILNSKSYLYLDVAILNQKIDKNLELFNKYICKYLGIKEIINLDIMKKTEDTDNIKLINSHIQHISHNSKYYPSTSKIDFVKIQELLEKKGKNQLSVKEISKILNYKYMTVYRAVRKILRYKFLKSNRLNNKSNSESVKYQTIYYCDYFSKMIQNDSFFIFIDECSFNSNKRSNKIWVNSNKNNIMYDKGRISGLNLILSVSRNEIFHYNLSNKRLDSKGFICYIEDLEEKIKNSLYLNSLHNDGKITLIFDNCPIHKSKEFRNYIEEKKFRILTLPSYSPYYNINEFVFANLKKGFYQNIYSSR